MSAIVKRLKSDCDPLVSQVAQDETNNTNESEPSAKRRLVEEDNSELDLLLTDIELSLQHIHESEILRFSDDEDQNFADCYWKTATFLKTKPKSQYRKIQLCPATAQIYFFSFLEPVDIFEMATEEKNLNEEMDFDLTKKKKKKSKGLSLEAEKELELAGEDLRKSKTLIISIFIGQFI